MKKHIANIVTGARMVFSLPLLFIPLSWAWFFVYLICGLTDMIDGTIARKTGSADNPGMKGSGSGSDSWGETRNTQLS